MQLLAIERTSWGTDLPRPRPAEAKIRVLVLDGDETAVTRAVQELRGAGHVVERCREQGALCHLFMTDPQCPLNRGRIDVALIAREHPWPDPPLERGTTCMLRAGVPIARIESASHHAVQACLEATTTT